MSSSTYAATGDAALPGRHGEYLALPWPVPWLDLPQHGQAERRPVQKEAYGKDGLDKEDWAMTPAPDVGVHKGMIFASMNPDVPPIEDFIGGMNWYLDFYLNKTPAGSEVIGAPTVGARRGLEARRRELLRRQLPHPVFAHPP
jgi:hypothetical protein